MARTAATLTSSGASKSGKPWARLMAACSSAKRVISRITDSVNRLVRRAATNLLETVPLTPRSASPRSSVGPGRNLNLGHRFPDHPSELPSVREVSVRRELLRGRVGVKPRSGPLCGPLAANGVDLHQVCLHADLAEETRRLPHRIPVPRERRGFDPSGGDRLFHRLPLRSLHRRLAGLDVALRKGPRPAIACSHQEELHALGRPPVADSRCPHGHSNPPRRIVRARIGRMARGYARLLAPREASMKDTDARSGARTNPSRSEPLSDDDLRLIDAYWRAANYLSVGQIYLLDNPLLTEPLRPEHVKPRLLGHWGTTPGLNFIYVHLNRVIRAHDLNVVYICGPGHGGPAIVSNTYLEGTYSEFYPNVSQDEKGLQKLFKQFSFPGGIPSHTAAEVPGSMHEGGELGYAVSHAFGAALDNPDLLVACVVGDGEAETGPLATSWHSNKFLNAKTDGAVLPILHLNGYKIANPTVLARIYREGREALFRGYGYAPYFVEGDDPMKMHQLMASTLDVVVADIRRIQSDARTKAGK